MVQVGSDLIGKDISPVAQAKLFNNPNQLRCKHCKSLLDLRYGYKLNDYTIQTKCPSCQQDVNIYRKRINTRERRSDGSVISTKQKKLSKKERKSLRKKERASE